jgi:hypothetical protein
VLSVAVAVVVAAVDTVDAVDAVDVGAVDVGAVDVDAVDVSPWWGCLADGRSFLDGKIKIYMSKSTTTQLE